MAPGVNGRQTGTVPKTKTHNDSSRDFTQASRREQGFHSIPNNLVTLDWQPAPDIGHNRTRKTSNTQTAPLDYHDLVSESGVAHDNSRCVPPHYSHGDEQLVWGAMNRSQEMNGRSEGSGSTCSSLRRSKTPRNVLPDKESKSNNINKMPDRNQVVSRLNHIHDYIKQTSSLMDTLKNSGDPRHQAQYHKLSKMIADLRDSESRLASFLPELNNVLPADVENKLEGTVPDNVSGNVAGSRSAIDVVSASRSYEEPSGAVLKSSDSARRNELKMKVEESQRRLQALQEHQAALLTLQEKAQEQLKEAKVAQGILMARAVGVQCTPNAATPAGDDQPNSSLSSQHANSSAEIQGNMENLSDRLHSLHELYENRNQLVQLLGERDEELVSEHMVLQDKLQELQNKKQQMDHLVAEFQALNNLPNATTGSQVDAGSSKDGSEDGEGNCSDGESDYQSVREKMAELSMMKAQLAQLKGIMSAVQNRESASQLIPNGTGEGSGMGDVTVDVDHEEQAVNLRRQKRDKVKSSVKGLVRSNSNTSATSSNKPDNILQATSGIERTRDIHHKTLQLQEAKTRLQQLQDLLATVSDFHNRGQVIPEHYIELLTQEASKENGAGDSGRHDFQQISRERTPVRQDGVLPEGSEVTLEMVQAITLDLRQETQNLQEERERLVSARRALGKLQRELPLREKKTNTQVDAQTQQMLLQAELQAKRRELEELMRKDQGQTSAINQDVCSELSADKSEAPGYSFLAEGTTNATWGGSTQGTLDDLAEQDNDIQEQSAGYSSDEGQEDEDEDDHTFPASTSQQHRLTQLNNKETLSQSVSTTRDMLSMDSGRISLTGNINTNHSNSTSVAGSIAHAPAPSAGNSRPQRPGPSYNVWSKQSSDSGTSAPRAVWTPSSQQARQENLCSAEDLVTSNNLESNNTSSASTLQTTPNTSTTWWQQQALQLQHQLEMTSNLYQSMLLEQQQQQHQHGNNLLTAMTGGNNMLPYWGIPPPPYPQPHSIAAGGHLIPASAGPTPDAYYQHLLAASQLQQQQMLLTTVNQCCHLLWLQQREMTALRAAVHSLQEKAAHGNNTHTGETYSPPVVIGQPEETILITSNQNSAQPTPHQSQSNLTRLQQSSFSPHQNLKLSYSGGLFQSPEELNTTAGVTSAHSLPNLSHVTTTALHSHNLSSNTPLNNMVPPFNPVTSTQTATQNFPTGTFTLAFPLNNNMNFNNRSQQQPLSSLIQCSAPQPGSGAPWLQQGAPGGTQGLLQGHTTPSPVPALNNQVPPGNRANNYWDNFRSYSRQNLLSTSTKSNEGVSHSPSPLVDRSHNTLRGSSSMATPILSQNIAAIYPAPDQITPRKEKLNTEQEMLSLPGPTHNNMADSSGLHYLLIGAPSSSSSRPRSRDRHNMSDFQTQPDISSSRATSSSSHRQLSNDYILMEDVHLQANTSTSGRHTIPNQPNFVPATEFHVEPETRNISVTGQDPQYHQNFTITSSYQGTRENVPTEVHVSKSQMPAAVVNKRKNPKTSASQDCDTTERKPHQLTNALFEALSESVYSEVAALISANHNRPHFLIQLFRDLQMISSDPLRQKTLQSIHEVVSRYLASGTTINQQSISDNQQSTQIEATLLTNERVITGSNISSDDENMKESSSHFQMPDPSLLEQTELHCLQNLVLRCEPDSGSQSIAESEEGATAVMPSAHSSPRALPRNAAWSIKDGLSLPSELPGRSSKLDWEVQAVLVDLLPFLKAHLDDTCSSSLLEAVRRLTLQLVPAQNLSLIASPTQHSSQHSRLGCCYQGQLDALLEDALLKFQGCRLRDVSEELLTVVAEVLLSELTFLRLVDTVSRGDNVDASNEECCKNPPDRDHDIGEHSKNSGVTHEPSESSQHFLNTADIGSHIYHDSREVTLGAEAYNGDLAEADQSHHAEAVGIAEMEAENAESISPAEEISIEGAAATESCVLASTMDCTENDMMQTEGIAEGPVDFIKTEMEEDWEVEQDREQGLDRVPTRLSTEQPRGASCSGRSSPERDNQTLLQHSDAAAP